MMSTTVVIGLLVALALLIFVLSPFWLGPGGTLVPSSQLNDAKKILSLKAIVLKRYIKEEQAATRGEISKGEWQKRRQFLTNRYIDLARRYDYLQHLATLANSQAQGSTKGGVA